MTAVELLPPATTPATTSPWCPRCLADRGSPDCCTPTRLARIITVPVKPCCGGLPGDVCGCAELAAQYEAAPEIRIGGTR